jgi:TetR/AcrR family transcriptional regulator
MYSAGDKTEVTERSARQRLLDGAMQLFDQKGYAAATVREIVETAKVTKPVLYYYFRNKEGIYLELMRETFSKFEKLLIISQEEKGSAREKLLRFSDRSFSLFLEDIMVVRIMYAIYYGPHQGAPFFDFEAYHVKFQEAVRGLVEEGVRNGEFSQGNIEDMTWAIIGAINVAMEVELGHPEMEAMKLGRKGLARVLNLIFQGLANGRKSPAGRKK